MEEKRLISKAEGWSDFAIEIADTFPDIKMYLLNGDLGAGKTSFVKSMVKILGSGDLVQSPTFSIINEYSYPAGKIFHMDLYRLNSLEEVLDLGFEEYINAGAFCFIEWPDIAFPLLRGPVVDIFIQNNQESGREARFSYKNL